MPSLRELLEVPWALPADVDDSGRMLVQWNVPGTFQLYLVEPGASPTQLTDLGEPVNGQFVPGANRILLEMDEGGNERAQLYLLDAEPGAAPEPLVVEPEFLHVSPRLTTDGRWLAYSCNRRNGRDLDVFVRSLGTGEERSVLELGGYCWPAGFSPSGRWLAVHRLTDHTGDNDLHLVDLETGELVHVAPEEEDAYFGDPVWLPGEEALHFATSAGRDIAGIARYELGDRSFRYVHEDEWSLECHGDSAGSTLVVVANEEGYSRLELRDPASLALRTDVELPGRGVVESVVLSPSGDWLALGYSSPTLTRDAWLVETARGDARRVTDGQERLDATALVEPTLHRFDSFDGESVPVFLFQPPNVERPPVVIEIHGGPEAQRRPFWIPLVQYLVGSGYAVALPNVRGSTGYGKRYEHLDDRHLRLDSLRDVIALHDWLRDRGDVDAGRAVLYGGSYGGYMVLASLAFHPDRFAAAVGIVPVSSFVTFLENTSEWRRAFREREYGSLEHDRDFLLEVSPLTHVDRIVAPLFLIHGANDPRVPLSEAEQIHRALKERGIPTELLVYDDEGHGLNKLPNRIDAYTRVIAFLEAVLEPSPTAAA